MSGLLPFRDGADDEGQDWNYSVCFSHTNLLARLRHFRALVESRSLSWPQPKEMCGRAAHTSGTNTRTFTRSGRYVLVNAVTGQVGTGTNMSGLAKF
jgi:hypothetical protein